MEQAGDSSPLLELETVVVFVDVVESVRLLQRDEKRAIHLLRELLSALVSKAVMPCGGRVVERQGDGLLLCFDSTTTAVKCGLAMHEVARGMRPDPDPGEPLQLRVGVHADRLLTDATVLYGNGVNLAARVLQVAGPGETVVTSAVRDTLTDDVDFRIDDLGYCYLKHWSEPMRLWRVWPPQPTFQPRSAEAPSGEAPDARLSIAVLSFEGSASLTPGLGDFLNGAFVATLAKQATLRVTSPLSATRLKGGPEHAGASANHLAVRYVLTGTMQQLGGRLIVNPQLVDTHRNEVVWADQVMAPLDDWVQPNAQPVQQILEGCVHSLNDAHIRETHHRPLPQLDSHALMAGAVALMHRASGAELPRSEAMLQAVIERHRRAAEPRAWLAKWHVLASVQGFAADPMQAHLQAIDCANRALDADPEHAIALAIKGHAMCHEGRTPDLALQVLQQAVQCNGSEASAWLYQSVWHHMWGNAESAIECAQMSLRLSPLDPQKALQEMMLGTAYLAAGEVHKAIEAYSASVSRNRCHLPALRALVAAHFEAGNEQQARLVLCDLLKLQPELTVNGFLGAGASNPIRRRVAYALSQLGVP
jgi:adenylate cyclase